MHLVFCHRRLAILLGLCLFSPSVLALAPHPCVLTVKRNGNMCPVIHYGWREYVVIIDGHEKTFSGEPDFALQDASAYADNYIDAPGPLNGKILVEKLGGPHATQMPDNYALHVTLVARETMKRGFVVVALFPNPTGTPSDDKPPQLVIEQLYHTLPAGEAVPLEIEVGAVTLPKDPRYFILVFDDNGREVMTNGSRYVWEYFAKRDRARLSVAVKMYLEKFKNTDHDAVVAVHPKPVFPKDVVPPKTGLSAVLTITEEGHVAAVEINGAVDAALNQSLVETLEGWLFLPKLKAGQPVPVKVAIPLQC